MIKAYQLIFALIITLLSGIVGAQTSYSNVLGIALPNKLTLAKTQEELLLSGFAVNTLWGDKIYVGALYIDHIEKRGQMLLLNDSPMAMVFYFVQDDITPQMLIKVFTEGILMNTGKVFTNTIDKDRIVELQNAFTQNLNAGDVLEFQYSPKNGVLMLLNGNIKREWPNAKIFFNMLLRMWIGPYPPTREFKKAILNFPA